MGNDPGFSLHEDGGSEIKITQEGNLHSAKSLFGKLDFQQFASNELSAWFSRYYIEKDVELTGTANIPIIELHIAYQNHFECSWDGVASASNKKNMQFNLSYVPFINNKATFHANKKYSTFDVHVSKDFLISHVALFPALEVFLNNIEKKVAADFSLYNHYASSTMISILDSIINSRYNHEIKKELLRHQLSELVIIGLHMLSEKKVAGKQETILHPSEIESLHALKEMLDGTSARIPLIPQLAKKYCLNEYKLKTGFKRLFGTSIYQYHIHCRMEIAKKILLDTDQVLQDVALDAGFEDVPNFSALFKKKYGCPPGYYRKNHKK